MLRAKSYLPACFLTALALSLTGCAHSVYHTALKVYEQPSAELLSVRVADTVGSQEEAGKLSRKAADMYEKLNARGAEHERAGREADKLRIAINHAELAAWNARRMRLAAEDVYQKIGDDAPETYRTLAIVLSETEQTITETVAMLRDQRQQFLARAATAKGARLPEGSDTAPPGVSTPAGGNDVALGLYAARNGLPEQIAALERDLARSRDKATRFLGSAHVIEARVTTDH